MAIASGSLDPEVRLYNPAGEQICSASYPFGQSAGFECNLPATGTYTLLANDDGLSDTGTYGLHLQRLNNPSGAVTLSFGQSLQATIGAVGERDAYTFSATVCDRVPVTMAISSRSLHDALPIYNPAGEQICSASYPFGQSASFECNLPATGTYVLLANDDGLSDIGSYGLRSEERRVGKGGRSLEFR